MGAVNEAKFAEFITKFAAFYAPTIDFAVNPKVPGLKVTGNFQKVMETISPIWLGFAITRIENTKFAIKADVFAGSVMCTAGCCGRRLPPSGRRTRRCPSSLASAGHRWP